MGRPGRAHLVSHTVLPGCALQGLLQSCGVTGTSLLCAQEGEVSLSEPGLHSSEMGGHLRDRL